METKNNQFNAAWEMLQKYHPTQQTFPNGQVIDLSKKPKVSAKDWRRYISALQAVLIIGKRNGWLHIHQDWNGFPVFLYVPDKI